MPFFRAGEPSSEDIKGPLLSVFESFSPTCAAIGVQGKCRTKGFPQPKIEMIRMEKSPRTTATMMKGTSQGDSSGGSGTGGGRGRRGPPCRPGHSRRGAGRGRGTVDGRRGGLGIAEGTQRGDGRAGTVSIGQEAEVVVLELGRGRAEGPERLGLGPRRRRGLSPGRSSGPGRCSAPGRTDNGPPGPCPSASGRSRAKAAGTPGATRSRGSGSSIRCLKILLTMSPPSNGGRPARAK